MFFKIKKELNEFKKFKENYEFEQKDIKVIEGNKYCDGELLQAKDEPLLGESEKWINIGYKLGSYSKLLSNLFPYEFTFRGVKLASIENFFQGIKFKDKKIQKYVCKYYGTEAVHIKNATSYNWKETYKVYWKGKEYDRLGKEYYELVDEMYISAIQNPLYRQVILNTSKPLIHSIGETNKEDTTFTRYEFEFEINCLKDFLKPKNTRMDKLRKGASD